MKGAIDFRHMQLYCWTNCLELCGQPLSLCVSISLASHAEHTHKIIAESLHCHSISIWRSLFAFKFLD